VNLYRCGDLTDALQRLKTRGVRIVGASEKTDRSLGETDLTGAIAIVVGNEGRGPAPERLEVCDEIVSIPLAGAVESLNAAVAVGVVLYEAVRQRTAQK
jgi:23S rRNA (guanosine2251-2'-O)-methyltransferase